LFKHYEGVEPGNWIKTGDWHGARHTKRLITHAVDRTRST
jgi:inorganic pyrophosphatase